MFHQLIARQWIINQKPNGKAEAVFFSLSLFIITRITHNTGSLSLLWAIYRPACVMFQLKQAGRAKWKYKPVNDQWYAQSRLTECQTEMEIYRHFAIEIHVARCAPNVLPHAIVLRTMVEQKGPMKDEWKEKKNVTFAISLRTLPLLVAARNSFFCNIL